MKPITPEQAIRLIRRHWKTVGELLETYYLIDMASDSGIKAVSNYMTAVNDLDKELDTKKTLKEGKIAE